MKTLFLLILSTALALISVSPADALVYHAFIWDSNTGMTDLGGLADGLNSIALGINDSGQVVGSAGVDPSTTHAFIWTEATGMVDIGTPGGAFSQAFAINSNGVVAGEGDDANGERVAFLWTSSGGFVTLGRSGYNTVGYAINDSGWITGYRYNGPISDGFIWKPNKRTSRLLGNLPGGNESVGWGINNLNHVTGSGGFPNGTADLFLWTRRDGLLDLGRPDGSNNAIGMAINDNDEIVGSTFTTPFYWSDATGFRTLQTFNGRGGSASAVGVNNGGQIVGWSSIPTSTKTHAVLWADSLSAPQDLGILPGGNFSYGEAINNLGQVVGWGNLQTNTPAE